MNIIVVVQYTINNYHEPIIFKAHKNCFKLQFGNVEVFTEKSTTRQFSRKRDIFDWKS